MAYLMNNTALNGRFRKDSMNGFFETLAAIDTGDEDIFDASVLELGDDAKPEFRALTTSAYPMTQHISVAI